MFAVSKRPTISEIQSLYLHPDVLPTDITTFFLNRSEKVDVTVKSVLRYTKERALKEAQSCNDLIVEYKKRYKAKSTVELDNHSTVKLVPINPSTIWFQKLIHDYPLFGIPYNLKDNILVEGEIATSASSIMKGFVAPYSATVYTKLRDAGAILISQSNLDEWAVGASTENSAFGATHNPFDLERVPGGSSGGPAAVVASGQVVFSLGSDTGGSIRVPAAFCDLVGVKPTYGTISRYGVMPLASSLDQVGPLTNNVEDNLLILRVLAGKSINDQTTMDTKSVVHQLDELYQTHARSKDSRPLPKAQKKLKIGIPKEYFVDGIDPKIKEHIDRLISSLSDFGHKIVQVSLPLTRFGLAVYYTTMTVETAANLQRFEGIRYGVDFREPEHALFYHNREKGLGDEPKRRIMLSTFASSSGYFDAYYNTAVKVKEQMKKDFDKVFKKCDVLLAPTTPEFAFKFGEKTADPIKMYLSDALVYGANLTRIPAINVPIGHIQVEPGSKKKLPTGVQVIAPEFGEEMMYRLSFDIEQLTNNVL
jgi:aspartyl-tRNA(Asn)/glutamyl-tRNA(Gln) amidotransferase subunit A